MPSVVSEVSVPSHRSVHGGKRAQGRDEATPFDALLDTTASETEPKKASKADKPEKTEKPERPASSRAASENDNEPRDPAAAGTETEAEPAAETAAPADAQTGGETDAVVETANADIETGQTAGTDPTIAVPAVTVETPAQPAPVPTAVVAVAAAVPVAVPVAPEAAALAADAEIAGVAPVGNVALPETVEAAAAPQTAPAETVTPEDMPAEVAPQIAKAAGEKPAEDKAADTKVKAQAPAEDGKPAPKPQHAETADNKAAPVAAEGPAKPDAPVAKPKPEVEAPRIENVALQRDHNAMQAAASGGNPSDVVTLATVQAQAVHATGPAVSATRNDQAAVAIPLNGLAVEIAAQQRAGKNRFEIRLDPPELGRIDVRLDMDKDGNVTSRLLVERAETLDLLRRDAHQLERALNQAGLKTSDNSLEFQLRDQGFANNERNERQNGREAAQIIIPDDDATVLEAKRGYGRLLGLGNGLDISV